MRKVFVPVVTEKITAAFILGHPVVLCLFFPLDYEKKTFKSFCDIIGVLRLIISWWAFIISLGIDGPKAQAGANNHIFNLRERFE